MPSNRVLVLGASGNRSSPDCSTLRQAHVDVSGKYRTTEASQRHLLLNAVQRALHNFNFAPAQFTGVQRTHGNASIHSTLDAMIVCYHRDQGGYPGRLKSYRRLETRQERMPSGRTNTRDLGSRDFGPPGYMAEQCGGGHGGAAWQNSRASRRHRVARKLPEDTSQGGRCNYVR